MGQVNFPNDKKNKGDSLLLIFSFISFMTGAVLLTFYWIFGDQSELSLIRYLITLILTVFVFGGMIFTLMELSSD